VILGWNESMGAVLMEIDLIVGPGSRVIIFSPRDVEERVNFVEAAQKRRRYRFHNIVIEHRAGSLGARFKLEDLPLEKATKILILSDSLAASANEADGQTTAVILQVWDILSERERLEKLVIVPQILERSSGEACNKMGLMDYINSNELSARIVALVAESPMVSAIIDDIVSDSGCRFCIRELDDYPEALGLVAAGHVSFCEVAAVAAFSDEVAIGWSDEGADAGGPWEINPKDKTRQRTWNRDSRVIAMRRSQMPQGGSHQLPKSETIAKRARLS